MENDPVTGQPLMLRAATGTVSLYVNAGPGNPVGLTTDCGSQAFAYKFDPYGVPVLTTSSGGMGVPQNPFLFAGGIQDRANGWVHFGARWYNPATGRWTQQDTLDNPLDPANANRYAYAGNDPINNIDPSGRALDWPTIGEATVAAAAGLAAGAVLGLATASVCAVTALVGCIGAGIVAASISGGIGAGTGAAVYGKPIGESVFVGLLGG